MSAKTASAQSAFRGAIIVAMALVMSAAAAFGAGQAVKLSGPANSFAHIYRAFPATTGNEISAQVSVKAGPNAGSSWAPSVFLYWSATAFIGIGQQQDGSIRINAQGTPKFSLVQPGIRPNDWTDLKINLSTSTVQLLARPAGGEWVLITEFPRPEGFAAMPVDLIIGKGFGNNTPTYPAEHLDNSTATPGKLGASYVDDVMVTVDGKIVLVDSFDSLNGWSQHKDPLIDPIVLIPGNIASEPIVLP